MKNELVIEKWKVKNLAIEGIGQWKIKNEKWIGKLKHYCPLIIAKRSLVDSNDK